jgi:hypothetical protein
MRWKNVLLVIPRALFLLPSIPRALWMYADDREHQR